MDCVKDKLLLKYFDRNKTGIEYVEDTMKDKLIAVLVIRKSEVTFQKKKLL
jgi:hypothetical protein